MVCNEPELEPMDVRHSRKSQSPYGARWFATGTAMGSWKALAERSQSPYGARWFATKAKAAATPEVDMVAIPLRG